MWRGTLLILPLFVLIGAGCLIGNSGNEAEAQKVSPSTEGAEVSEEEVRLESPTMDTLVEGVAEVLTAEGSVGVEPILMPLEVSLKSGNFFFDPPLIEAKPGQEVRVSVSENMGLHTFVVDELALKVQLADGAVFSFIAPQTPGDYVFYCNTGEHRQLGMEGILRIQ